MRLPAFLMFLVLFSVPFEAQAQSQARAEGQTHGLPLAPGAQFYTTEQLVGHFVQSIDMGAARGICIGTPADCAAPAAEAPPPGLDMLVNFEHDSATLTPEAAARLSVFAEMMQDERLEIARFVIEGHTDARGAEEYNQALSEARAETVRAWLTGLGIAPERLSALGFGKSKPRTGDHYDPANRRVELRLDRD